MDDIYSLSYELKDLLTNDPRIIRLNELEKKLNESFEVYQLSQRKDECLETYTKLKEVYPDEHEDVVNALKNLVEAKKVLNSHPLVKEYLSIYNDVRDLYMEIDNVLFSDFKARNC